MSPGTFRAGASRDQQVSELSCRALGCAEGFAAGAEGYVAGAEGYLAGAEGYLAGAGGYLTSWEGFPLS